MNLTRRGLMALGGGLALSSSLSPTLALARAATERRLVFIIQRGAADGLGTLAPVGDPAFVSQRGALAEDFASAARLDSVFALHPALARTGQMYAAREALFVHAVASPYRDRSHFDGQNVLETGAAAPYQRNDGWLNRLSGLLPEGGRAIALSPTIPLALRGAVEVANYAPTALPDPAEDLLARVSDLYEGDPQLHAAFAQATATRKLAAGMAAGPAGGGLQAATATGALAAKLLSAEGGARIAMIETTGWDTHAGQRARLAAQLRSLDAMTAALRDGLGPLWSDTLVIVATEFGRTVRPNGTQGTDHGTASLAMLLGGAVNGGRIVADWPGLSDGALHEGRDLRPTASLDGMIAGAVSQHFGLSPDRTMTGLFPGAPAAPSMRDLVRA